jgi:hypothetical protein
MNNKPPLELVSYFKNKEARKEDGSYMSDSEKRRAALDTVKRYKKQKDNKKEK